MLFVMNKEILLEDKKKHSAVRKSCANSSPVWEREQEEEAKIFMKTINEFDALLSKWSFSLRIAKHTKSPSR